MDGMSSIRVPRLAAATKDDPLDGPSVDFASAAMRDEYSIRIAAP